MTSCKAAPNNTPAGSATTSTSWKCALDTVVESANEGTDEICANFGHRAGHPLLQHVENLTFIGNIGLIGSGNALANTWRSAAMAAIFSWAFPAMTN